MNGIDVHQLAAAYALDAGNATRPATDVRLMMQPEPWAFITGTAYLIPKTTLPSNKVRL